VIATSPQASSPVSVREELDQHSLVFEVGDSFKASKASDFFLSTVNKAALQKYICEKWEKDLELRSAFGSRKLYLGGDFEEQTRTVIVEGDAVTPITDLESTQEEADTRVVLHALYSYLHDGVERIVIYASDTDIILT